MIRNPQSHKSIIIVLAVIFLLTGCNFRENFAIRNLSQDQQAHTGRISDQDMNNSLPAVKNVDAGAEAKYRLARYLQKRERHKIALETLKEVIFIDPAFVEAHNAMGVSYDCIGDFKKAIRSYKLALQLNPNLDYVYNNLGFAYLLDDNYDAAIDAFRKAVALNDQNKRFHNNLGYAYAKKGQFDLALQQFRLTGDEFSANHRLGQILYRDRNYEMAFKYNEKAYYAKASAQILSPIPTDSGRKSLEGDEKKPEAGMSDLSGSKKEYTVPGEDQFSVTPKNEGLMTLKNRQDPESSKTIVQVEIEVSNGNGVDGMAKRLGDYLRTKGFKVTRLSNANCFNHTKTKIFYYNGHLKEVNRLLQEIPGHQDISHAIELKHTGNRIKILIGKDIAPFDEVISNADSTKHTS